MKKVVSIEQAADLIQDGDEILFNGFGSMGFPEEMCKCLGEKFEKSGHPKDMTYICGAGQGVWNEKDMIEHISKEGMVKRVVTSHFVPMRNISRQVIENKIEGYNVPLGIISHIVRASAGRKPGVLSKVGLKTFIDPRYGRGAMNQISKDSLSEVMSIDGEEYLFYKAFKPNATILRGTSADIYGNITLEKEALYVDIYEMAMCVKANGGKVIVQVERLLGKQADARKVKVPGILVDAIVVAPTQKQSMLERYNPAVSGEWFVPEEEVADELERIRKINSEIAPGNAKTRGVEHQIIARRAAMELEKGYVVNLGIGIAEMVPEMAKIVNNVEDLTLTIESGIIGGHAVGGLCFGAGINPQMLQEQGSQFDFYDGGGLDATFVGAMQIDKKGNVNVSKSGNSVIGVGGFINLTSTSKKVIYCFPFSGGGSKLSCQAGKLNIEQEGRYVKFVEEVEQISFSGEVAATTEQKVLYVTERAVFQLTKEGIMLIEIAPGVDLERDVLKRMKFKPLLAEHIEIMEAKIFDL